MRTILRYLMQHPKAADTAEGIATWWLQQHQIDHASEEVFRALEELVARDFLLEHRGPDGRRYYTLNEKELGAMTEFLRETESRETELADSSGCSK